MKKIFSLLASSVVLLCASTVANAGWPDFSSMGIEPYVGVDAQYRFMAFRNGYGGGVFKKQSPQGNIYVGLKFCDYLGLEAGYFASLQQSRNSTTPRGQRFLGEILTDSVTATSSSRIDGWHLNVLGFLPFCLSDYNFEAFGFVGLANVRVRTKSTITALNGIPDNGVPEIKLALTRTVLRAGAGLQYMLTDCIGIRGAVTWENTSRLNNIRSVNSDNPALVAKLQDSCILGLGLFARF